LGDVKNNEFYLLLVHKCVQKNSCCVAGMKPKHRSVQAMWQTENCTCKNQTTAFTAQAGGENR
jgi:hypothetical protein